MHPDGSTAIPGYSRYRIMRDGRVWSEITSRWLVAIPDKDGYPLVHLTIEGRGRPAAIHRLLLLTFCGPPAPGQIGRHLDDNPANNALDNLRWGTHAQNVADSIRNGTRAIGERHPSHLHPETHQGERNGRAKLTAERVRELRRLSAEGWSALALAARYGVSDVAISYALSRKTWKHVH